MDARKEAKVAPVPPSYAISILLPRVGVGSSSHLPPPPPPLQADFVLPSGRRVSLSCVWFTLGASANTNWAPEQIAFLPQTCFRAWQMQSLIISS